MSVNFFFQLRTTALLMACACLTAVASAAPVVYTDRTAFMAAATGTTTVDFEGETVFTSRAGSFSVSGTTFTSDIDRMFTFDAGFYTPALPSDYLHLNDLGTHDIDISAAGMTAIGFDFGTLNGTFGTQTSVTVLDSLGNSYNITAPGQPALSFFGLTSDVVLTSVRVTGELLVLDNVTTGSAAAVPLPGSLALVLLGLAGVGLRQHRRA